ncbi:MAG: cytochrome c [Rhizobiaceae bacterium]|nr:cytochrome c [Rhizobiaceae bacterium]
MRKRTAAATAALLMLTAAGALSHSGATGIVKERMDVMNEISRDMKAIAGMVRGKSPFDADEATAAARAIADHAQALPKMFPEGSMIEPSEASPDIWDEWRRFVALSRRMKSDALSLADAAETAPDAAAFRSQFRALGQSCLACHEAFRVRR